VNDPLVMSPVRVGVPSDRVKLCLEVTPGQIHRHSSEESVLGFISSCRSLYH
jgi:hypothetical protein